MRLTTLLLMLACTPALAEGPNDGPSGKTLDRIATAVVKVNATDCGNVPSRTATGFAWQKPGWIVTDYHVVVGCNHFSVRYSGDNDLKEAKVGHRYRDADLAMLIVTNPPPVVPPDVSDRIPDEDEIVKVFGYPLGLPFPDDHRLRLTSATRRNPQLRAGLDETARRELVTEGFPNLDFQVLHLDGALLPGHSGAPIIDYLGKVVGIGSGGLEQGTASIAWAMRTQYLQGLLDHNDLPGAQDGHTTNAHFAFVDLAAGGSDPPTVKCGQLTLVRRRMRTLGELVASSEDPAAINRLAEDVLKIKLETLAGDPIAIWTEQTSGAAVALPTDATIQPGRYFCTIPAEMPELSLFIRLVPMPSSVQVPEWQYEYENMRWTSLILLSSHAGAGLSWAPRAGWFVNRVVNGVSIDRRVMAGTRGDKASVRVFRNDMAGRGAYILVGALDRDFKDTVPDAKRKAWARRVLSVYLTSFPAGREDQAATDTASGPASEVSPLATPDQAEADETSLTADATKWRSYASTACGWTDLVRLTPIRSLVDLVRVSDNPSEVRAFVQEMARVPVGSIGESQFDVWGQPATGTFILLPRGLRLLPQAGLRIPGMPRSAGGGDGCVVTTPDAPLIRTVLHGFHGIPLEKGRLVFEEELATVAQAPLHAAAVQPSAVVTRPGAARIDRRTLEGTGTDGVRARAYTVAIICNSISIFYGVIDQDPRPPDQRPPGEQVALALALAGARLSDGSQPIGISP
jgi:hypothetical protein